jgi:hypothetical protein
LPEARIGAVHVTIGSVFRRLSALPSIAVVLLHSHQIKMT